MQLSIGNVDLTGEIPAEEAQDFDGAPESTVQEAQFLRAASAAFFPRGNKKTQLTFAVDRLHDTAEDAADFCISHEAQFPVQGLFIYRTDGGEYYLANAVAVVTRYSFRGASTTHSYRVVGGAWLTSRPTVS